MNNPLMWIETPHDHTKETGATQNPTTQRPTRHHKEKQKVQSANGCTFVTLYNMVVEFTCRKGQKPKTP